MTLGDLGAEVIKLEKVGWGDDTRHSGEFYNGVNLYFPTENRNKKSVTINFRSDAGKKLLRGMTVLENRDAKWADIFQNAMFIGMISAFLGYVFCDFSRLWTPGDYAATSGLVPVCVMAVSAAIMVVCGLLMKKFKWSWVNDYALPISLVLGMASAIPLTAWLG